jgi:phospholipase/carboxylesterase
MSLQQTLQQSTARAADLTVRIVQHDALAKPSALVVLCHGYGAPGTDLVGIASELVAIEPKLAQARFVFPEAPLALEHVPFGGRAWWHIDVERFANAMATGEVGRLMDETPEGMPKARKQLLAALDVLEQSSHGAPLVLGGFSQGAMLATDVALRREEAPSALVVFSGTLLSRSEWTTLAARRAGLPTLQTHGTNDPILPFAVALELKAMLEGAGLTLTFHSFPGGHGIDGEALEACAALVTQVARPL